MTVGQLSVVLAATVFGAGCTSQDRSSIGGPTSVPRVHLGGQSGVVAVTATYPNPCEIDLDFGNVPVGLIDSAAIQIENIGDEALDVSQVVPTLDPEFSTNWSAPPPIQPGGFGQFTVSFQPYKLGPVSSMFTVQTNGTNAQCPAPSSSGGANSITVALAGNGIQLSLVVEPNVLDFGNTYVNTSATKSVTLINKSTAAVTGITTSVIGSDANLFFVRNAPATLEAGDSATVDISYSPLATETRSLASVEFSGSDGEKASLNLFGEPVTAALSLAPNPIDFGFVPVGTTAVGCTTASNGGNTAVSITGITALDGFANEGGAFALASTDDSTPPQPFSLPVTVNAGATSKVCFQLTPTATRQYSGDASLVNDDPSGSSNVVELTGWGGGPQISCAPLNIDFGPTAAYTSSTIPVLCTNEGTGVPDVGLLVNQLQAGPTVFTAQFDASTPIPPDGLAPGQSVQIDVSYAPTATADDEGTLIITSNGNRGRPIQIHLSGQGLGVPPCQFAISPTAIDFGNVPPGGTSVAIPFEVRNIGTDRCVVQSLTFSGDAGGSFRIASATPDWDPTLDNAIVLPAPTDGAASGVTFMLELAPPAQGDAGAQLDRVPAMVYSVEAVVSVANPANAGNVVALSGTSGPSCLVIAPPSLDQIVIWPPDAGGPCTNPADTFSIFNSCPAPQTIRSFMVQSGPWEAVPQFSAPSEPVLPFTVKTGASVILPAFTPTTPGTHTGQLLISDGIIETLVPMSGTTVSPEVGCR